MSHRPIRRPVRAALVVALALGTVLAPGAASAEENDDLTQRIDPNQSQGTGQVVVERGHVDFGPTLNTGEWKIQIHDDSDSPSYWRNLEDVVMKVADAGILEVPDSADYAFLGAEPGTPVWVVPQTQKSDVVWTGWNTQEPGVLSTLKVGTTLSVLGVEGPGDVIAYLQSGNFGAPQPLWSTRDEFPQQTWIEVNTHTHANWVFTEPGVYLVDVQFDGELTTGETVSAQDTLRFAVGDATDPQPAFTMTSAFDAIEAPVADPEAPDAPVAGPAESETAFGPVLFIVIGAVGGVLIIALIVVGVAGRKTKARVRAARRAKEKSE